MPTPGLRSARQPRWKKTATVAPSSSRTYAGLRRLGLETRAVELLPLGTLLTAAGAGVVVVEHRALARVASGLLRAVNDSRAERLLRAERGVLGGLGGDCRSENAQ